MATNQELRHQSVRAITGTARDYNSDWMALFAATGFTVGTFNERMLRWINDRLSAAHTSLPGAMQAFAEDQGYDNWSSMGTFVGNAEAEDLFEAFDDQPSLTHKGAYDRFYTTLKLGPTSGSDILAKLDRAWAPWAETEQQYSIDLVHPADSDPITFVNSPTFTAGHGHTYNGTDQYGDTNFNPTTDAVNFLQNSHSIGWRSETNAQVASYAIGWNDGTDAIGLAPRTAADRMAFAASQTSANASLTTISAITDSRYFAAFNRSASNATQAYASGAALTVTSNANHTSAALNNHNLNIAHPTDVSFGAYDGGGPLWLGGSMTAAEHLDIRNAFVALRTALKA